LMCNALTCIHFNSRHLFISLIFLARLCIYIKNVLHTPLTRDDFARAFILDIQTNKSLKTKQK